MQGKKYALNKNFIVFRNDRNRLAAGLGDSGITAELQPGLLAGLVELGGQGTFDREDFLLMVSSRYKGDKEAAESLFETLCSCGFLVSPAKAAKPAKSRSLSWEENGWLAAGLFHQSVAYSSFLLGDKEGWDEQVSAMTDIKESGEVPPMVKEYPGRKKIKLPPSVQERQLPFFEVLENRKTIRSFKRETPITKQLLASILYHAARAKTVGDSHYFGNLMRRTSPSGGSMHPVEIYPQLIGVKGLRDGNYYYNPEHHALVQLEGAMTREMLYELSQRQIRLEGNFLAFIITARFIRHFWKYRYPKSYAFTLFDVGHFVQTLILTCEAMGLKCFLTPALNVEIAQKHLDLDNIFDECPVYLVVAG
jgi:SagB-type dehydrogenase family enzyme